MMKARRRRHCSSLRIVVRGSAASGLRLEATQPFPEHGLARRRVGSMPAAAISWACPISQRSKPCSVSASGWNWTPITAAPIANAWFVQTHVDARCHPRGSRTCLHASAARDDRIGVVTARPCRRRRGSAAKTRSPSSRWARLPSPTPPLSIARRDKRRRWAPLPPTAVAAAPAHLQGKDRPSFHRPDRAARTTSRDGASGSSASSVSTPASR